MALLKKRLRLWKVLVQRVGMETNQQNYMKKGIVSGIVRLYSVSRSVA